MPPGKILDWLPLPFVRKPKKLLKRIKEEIQKVVDQTTTLGT
jgi:hypothetical protein